MVEILPRCRNCRWWEYSEEDTGTCRWEPKVLLAIAPEGHPVSITAWAETGPNERCSHHDYKD